MGGAAAGAGQSNPSSAGSASSRRRGKGGGQASPGVGQDSWGAGEAEAALSRVKELEEQAALAEHKRKLAEERAVQLSSESANLMRSNEEKQVLAKALEMQMQELAQARQADALRSSREIEAATLEDLKARKALEDELGTERRLRQEAEHKTQVEALLCAVCEQHVCERHVCQHVGAVSEQPFWMAAGAAAARAGRGPGTAARG